ncbi:MAG TPA: hypothetical protein VM933_00035 [Acidimicrobiales bacterium]|nr:hypothetical protein [Acidimicrobiales bacterium]
MTLRRRGGCGVAVVGSAAAWLDPVLVDTPDDWPQLAIEVVVEGDVDAPGGRGFRVPLGHALVDGRSSAQLRYRRPPPVGAIASALAWVAAEVRSDGGAVALRGGAFAWAGRAYAVLGPPLAGTTSVLAALADAGADVVGDDAVVLQDGQLLAGPRVLWARSGDGRRAEVALRAVAPATPFEGWFRIEDQPALSVAPLPVPERVALLAAHCLGRNPSPTAPIELAARPGWRVGRSYADAPAAVAEVMLEAVDAAAGQASSSPRSRR